MFAVSSTVSTVVTRRARQIRGDGTRARRYRSKVHARATSITRASSSSSGDDDYVVCAKARAASALLSAAFAATSVMQPGIASAFGS